jgi:hypothetical protein
MGNGRQLAVQEAQRQGCDINIVLATVEAESEFINILGDNGNALGYGQVWLQWWKQQFIEAGQELGVNPPVNSLVDMQIFTLQNDEYSMAVTVKVIKIVWLGSNKDWNKFTLSYVGIGIPPDDYSRRKAIWDKYNGGNSANYYNSSGVGSSGNITGLGNLTGSAADVFTIDPTNYGIVKGSEQNKNILYGRRYRVLVSNAQGVALDVSDLRCTFSVTKTMQMQPNISELTIYNLNAETENRLIKEGNRIVIEAGYEGEQYGLIFDGDVIQPIRDKEDGVTFKLTLISMDGDRFFNQGFTNTTLLKGQTARSVVDGIMNKATNPAKFGSISTNLNDAQLTRGKVVFGLTRDYLRQIAQSQNAMFYIEDNKVNLIKMEDVPQGEIIELSPSSGLIGTPAQTEMGVNVKCLLNPQITVNKLIHIDNSLVREMQRAPVGNIGAGNTKPTTPVVRNLDGDGVYRIIKVTYKGDTRGDDWYCDCECISQAGILPSIATNPLANIR